ALEIAELLFEEFDPALETYIVESRADLVAFKLLVRIVCITEPELRRLNEQKRFVELAHEVVAFLFEVDSHSLFLMFMFMFFVLAALFLFMVLMARHAIER